jgi:hypothetical protein
MQRSLTNGEHFPPIIACAYSWNGRVYVVIDR